MSCKFTCIFAPLNENNVLFSKKHYSWRFRYLEFIELCYSIKSEYKHFVKCSFIFTFYFIYFSFLLSTISLLCRISDKKLVRKPTKTTEALNETALDCYQ